MKTYFDIVKNRMIAALEGEGFVLQSETDSETAPSATLASDTALVRIAYNSAAKAFELYRGKSDSAEDELVKSQTYLFDADNGDDAREAESVANDFLDAIKSKPAQTARSLTSRTVKNSDADENSAVFFVNRIPAVMLECRDPLLEHKQHYETLLPNFFCEEVVVPAMLDMLKDGRDKNKIGKFFDLLSNMYKDGDLDTKSIIVQTLLNSITDPVQMEFAEGKISVDLKKAWIAGRKYIGKEVKPEKMSTMAKIAQYQAQTLDTHRK